MTDRVSKEWIQKKSKELGIPFADCFRGLVLEELLYAILKEKKPLELVLENEDILGTAAYGKRIEPKVILQTKSPLDALPEKIRERLENSERDQSRLQAEDIKRRIAVYQREKVVENNACLEWQIGEAKLEENKLTLPVTGSFMDMKAPFTLLVKKADEDTLYKEEHRFKGMAQKEELSYLVCAPERQLGAWLYMIWNRLELIPSMDYYQNACLFLKNHAIDGRRIAEEIKKLWGSNSFTGDRIKTLEGYKDYSYMKKRWNSYWKNQKKESPVSWEEAVEMICAFSKPIWECLKEDRIFIGDWMPELGRFM